MTLVKEEFFAALTANGMPEIPQDFSVVPLAQLITRPTLVEIDNFIRLFDRITTRTTWQRTVTAPLEWGERAQVATGLVGAAILLAVSAPHLPILATIVLIALDSYSWAGDSLRAFRPGFAASNAPNGNVDGNARPKCA